MNEEFKSEEFEKPPETDVNKHLSLIENATEYSHLSEEKIELINKAKVKYKKIYLCLNKTIDESFTEGANGKPLFWFNTEDQSTRIVEGE